ncbi:glycerophosphodiester phosphodiesterase family protein [Methylobacterium sp. J-068]|uniref:glycerophosphodiester phosphodiesterase family protein n=1 Tax=Methylobacterium sp. J-068 TaxID=2836649 RepID=UPI001FBA5658|nr:glycerophosphodiester phosphodiesterase family protein [Methylobacterium sp. J-068]MCJ2036062.1 glycerophosphodiester phosphodiesterase [Methylobacterium sp. J-068]
MSPHGSLNAPAWLTARPVAHRGLHDRAGGVPENTLAAAEAAIRGGYAIECDVQLSADGEAMVFHDETLGRLTTARDAVGARPAAALSALAVAGSPECIPTLPAYLARIGGRTPLVIEVKSRYTGDLRLTERVADLIAAYDGPVAVKSFDPHLVAALRGLAPTVPRGIVAETRQDDPAYAALAPSLRRSLSDLLHFDETRPDFLSWRVDDLPCAPTVLCRLLGGRPVMTWTVRNPDQRRLAEAHADQMVFEGFRP